MKTPRFRSNSLRYGRQFNHYGGMYQIVGDAASHALACVRYEYKGTKSRSGIKLSAFHTRDSYSGTAPRGPTWKCTLRKIRLVVESEICRVILSARQGGSIMLQIMSRRGAKTGVSHFQTWSYNIYPPVTQQQNTILLFLFLKAIATPCVGSFES